MRQVAPLWLGQHLGALLLPLVDVQTDKVKPLHPLVQTGKSAAEAAASFEHPHPRRDRRQTEQFNAQPFGGPEETYGRSLSPILDGPGRSLSATGQYTVDLSVVLLTLDAATTSRHRAKARE